MGAVASEITSRMIVYLTVYLGADQRKHKLHVPGLCIQAQIKENIKAPRPWPLWPVNSPHKGPVTRKCFHLMTSSCKDRRDFTTSTHYFSRSGDIILGLYGSHNATPCLVLCHLVLSCMARNKPLPNMLMTVSNTDCNWLAPLGILYRYDMWNGYSYSLKMYMLKITKNPDKARRAETR